jgi:transcriptional regulator with XRE-family HTH domain
MMNLWMAFVNPNGVIGLLDETVPGAESLVSTVAGAVREQRERAGLSLSELAAAAGVAKSTLSQLEAGNANPSIETLWAIAKALGVPFGRLIEPPAPDVRVVRDGEGVRVQSAASPYEAELLLSASRRGSFELYRLTADPGPVRHAEAHSRGVVEHVLVLAGGMRAGPAAHPVELGPGDLASFAGDAPHVYETLVPGTRALLVMDYP